MKLFNVLSVAVNSFGTEDVREYVIQSDKSETELRKSFKLEKPEEDIVLVSECANEFFHLVMDNAKPVYFISKRRSKKTK